MQRDAELHPNLHALSAVVSPRLNQQLTKPWKRFARGLSHEIWVSQSESNMHIVAWLSRTKEDPYKLLSEVSTMCYMQLHTVPFGGEPGQSDRDAVYGQRMPGVHLYKIWGELPIEHQISLIGDSRCSQAARGPEIPKHWIPSSVSPFRLIHGDFDGQNMLIARSTDEKSPPRITAIIDWENTYSGPLYVLYEYPIGCANTVLGM
ncbi:hypothetical protein BT96DRAFT_1095141 [Gymnopus androsaceus JB14]|uniref:Aminoglycoside phosphotransferase domain-containing protein n=1 Tax=Gymnopus androsaceus JB14 TaxID=1447944 RepID=A0A6A4IGM0_9AGAR|nr:hypothetical protein BT96DRAFT_1095141 [Gymnopus androsaceus JB14]